MYIKGFPLKINFISLSLLSILGCQTIPANYKYTNYPYQAKESINNNPSLTKNKYLSKKDYLYLIKKGDTLWSIAKHFSTTPEQLAHFNGLSLNEKIRTGQTIKIPLGENKREIFPLFLWPVKGKIIEYFGQTTNYRRNKGLNIKTEPYTPVYAAEKGKVSFADYLKGYGKSVIIQHDKQLSTVYTNLAEIKLKTGDIVDKGDLIGFTGKEQHRGIYMLHFEVRKKHQAVNPALYLYEH